MAMRCNARVLRLWEVTREAVLQQRHRLCEDVHLTHHLHVCMWQGMQTLHACMLHMSLHRPMQIENNHLKPQYMQLDEVSR